VGRCPRCDSTRINQFRMPYGPMWCSDCGFRVEDKNEIPNPFIEAEKEGADTQFKEDDDPPTSSVESAESTSKSLGAALYELSSAGQQGGEVDTPGAAQSSVEKPESEDN
jgi:hypothetical protein